MNAFDTPRALQRPALRKYQEEAVSAVLKGLQSNDSTLLVMATGLGKCLGPGTLVLTYDGRLVPVELIRAGDRLMGPDSQPRTVIGTTNGSGQMFEIRPHKGEPWVCNWCHVLTLKHTETGEVVDIALDEYLKKNKEFKHLYKQFASPVSFADQWGPRIDPYIFGLWLGDGSKELDSFQVTTIDPEVVESLKEFAASWNHQVVKYHYANRCPRYAVSRGEDGKSVHSPLLETMRDLFRNKDIPREMLTASRKHRLELLAGLLDSDGHLHEGNFEIAQKNPAIANGICFLARSLGFKVTRSVKSINGVDYQRMYLIGDFSCVPNRIARKKAAPRLINKDPLRTGFTVHPLGHGEYYGFELTGDGRFLLGDFTVTHNTQVGCSVAEHFLPGKVLWLAHRKELVHQGAERLQLVTGEQVDIEMAELWASNRSRIVSASLDSIRTRLDRWPPDHFSFIVFDEFHHAVAKSYKKVWEHFTGKKLGMTATPDRGDEKALGQLTSDVAGVWDIVDGIEGGYLVPIKGRSVRVDEINLSSISKTAGDLAIGELDDEMVKHIEGIVQKTLEIEPNRTGIWFFPGVKSAELACDRLNALGQSCAFVCGETPKEERDDIMRGFKTGRYRHLTNCQVATEGFDAPNANMVVIGRPTLSRALYAQMVGRGLRVLPGTVDGVHEALDRCGRVNASEKPNCAVVDFAGNAGKHTLVTPEDLLGGDYTDEEVKLAKKAAKEGVDGDVLENLAAARKELKAMMAKLQSKVKATVQEFNPFQVLSMADPDPHKEAYREAMTPGQADKLATFNIKPAQMRGLSKLEAQKLIGSLQVRRNLGLCSLNQLAVLKKHCDAPTNLPFKQASKAMTYLAGDCQWNPTPEQRAVLQGMVSRK
jgi:superfamily II DNA or RNA helicase